MFLFLSMKFSKAEASKLPNIPNDMCKSQTWTFKEGSPSGRFRFRLAVRRFSSYLPDVCKVTLETYTNPPASR